MLLLQLAVAWSAYRLSHKLGNCNRALRCFRMLSSRARIGSRRLGLEHDEQRLRGAHRGDGRRNGAGPLQIEKRTEAVEVSLRLPPGAAPKMFPSRGVM